MAPQRTQVQLTSLGAVRIAPPPSLFELWRDKLRSAPCALRLALFALLFAQCSASLRAGWSFDTGLAPEAAADLLAAPGMQTAPAGSWLRLRGMEQSAVLNAQGKQEPLYPGSSPGGSIADRREALQRLREKNYRLVALLSWADDTWKEGVRDPKGLRQTPLDLREAFERCRLLALTYGDLIDYWEIGNEPDIAFVEENPETYAAFFKACALGIRRGFEERQVTSNKDQVTRGQAEREERNALSLSPSLFHSLTPAPSRVLMAALALPPGPWLEAFAANGGLSYTDGFNYHYYGYAEDFTGVYRQFEQAVSGLSQEQSAKSEEQLSEAGESKTMRDADSEFGTNFLPNAQGWAATTVAGFDFSGASAEANRALLQSRPLAVGEPALEPQGRWLVSPGVTVEETAEGWRFHVASWAPQPMRPAMAELPLPPRWRVDPDSLLTFEYRIAPAGEVPNGKYQVPSEGGSGQRTVGSGQRTVGSGQPPSLGDSTAGNPLHVTPKALPESGATRRLPIFLTEYGYGLLSREARATAEGCERQRAWFEAVGAQIRQLGIGGAMAFLLTPYLEQGASEFGLLMGSESAPAGARLRPTGFGEASWGGYGVSPALAALLEDGAKPLMERTWTVPSVARSEVVIDFVAGKGLGQAKNYGGYFLSGDYGRSTPAEGTMVLYNFSQHTQTGELVLQGDSWVFGDGAQRRSLTLAPGERQEAAVQIRSTSDRFAPSPARAVWYATVEERLKTAESARPPAEAGLEKTPPPQPTPNVTQSEAVSRGLRTPAAGQALFDVYFRTQNGNLYQTWQRLWANGGWQRYMERMGNYTMASYGRRACRGGSRKTTRRRWCFSFARNNCRRHSRSAQRRWWSSSHLERRWVKAPFGPGGRAATPQPRI